MLLGPCWAGGFSKSRKWGRRVTLTRMEAKSLHSGVTSQPSFSRGGAALRPGPPSEGAGSPRPGTLLHLPNLSPRPPRRSAFPAASLRPATIPGFPAPGFLPGFPPSAGARGAPRWRTATGRVLPPRPLLRHPLPARARRRAGGSGCGPGWWGRGPRCGSWWGWGCFTL